MSYQLQVLLGAAGAVLPEEVPAQLAHPGAVLGVLPHLHRAAERRCMVHRARHVPLHQPQPGPLRMRLRHMLRACSAPQDRVPEIRHDVRVHSAAEAASEEAIAQGFWRL